MIPSLPLSSTTRWGVNVLFLLTGVVALHLAQSVIIPLLIALMLAAVLGPAAAWLHRALKIRWSLACLTVIIGLLLFNVLLTFIFSVAVSRLTLGLPSYTDEEGFRILYRKLVTKAEAVSPVLIDEPIDPHDLTNPKLANEDRVIQYLRDVTPRMMGELAKVTTNWLWQGIVIGFILLFLLLEGRMLARRVVAIFGPSPEV